MNGWLRWEGRARLVGALGTISAFLVLVVLMVWLFVPDRSQRSALQPRLISDLDSDIEASLNDYWHRPIPLQGPAPASFSDREASLRPEACGSCHEAQYRDWKESLHSRALGPGPWGQIVDLMRNSPDDGVLCMTCHAPLSEQIPVLPSGAGGGGYERNPRFDARLQLRGITCAACHVRQHTRFGPPKAQTAGSTGYPSGTANHGGTKRTPYFERAEFCKDCHQFDPENSLLVNGKPLQDTYREWRNSIWGRGGAACQNCHMPDRRHLWKGIHDREWVRGGVRVEASLKPIGSKPEGDWQVNIEVASVAVGHKFPTYVTPKIFVRGALLDRAGKILPGTQKEAVIGWDARFVDGEWKEFFDTRIAPGEKFQHTFRWTTGKQAKKARAWVEVQPDHFYHVHFYPAYLRSGNLSLEGRRLIERALKESGESTYILFEETFPLG